MAESDDKTLAGLTGTALLPPTNPQAGWRAYDVTAVVTLIPIREVAPNPDGSGASGVWLSWVSDVPFYVILGGTAAVPDPDPTVRDDGLAAHPNMCGRIPANYEWMRWFTQSRAYAKVIRAPFPDGSEADGVLRIERVSVIFGRSNAGA